MTTTDEFRADVEALFGDMMRQPEVKALPQGADTDAAVMACARVVILRDYEDEKEEEPVPSPGSVLVSKEPLPIAPAGPSNVT